MHECSIPRAILTVRYLVDVAHISVVQELFRVSLLCALYLTDDARIDCPVVVVDSHDPAWILVCYDLSETEKLVIVNFVSSIERV